MSLEPFTKRKKEKKKICLLSTKSQLYEAEGEAEGERGQEKRCFACWALSGLTER